MLLWLAALLVETNVFVRIEFSFLPVGHTHMQLDQLFSRISSTTRSKNLFTLTDTMAHVSDMFKECGWSFNEVVQDIIDVEAMTRGFRHQFEGLGVTRDAVSGMKHSVHAIRVEKPAADAVPCVWYKEHDKCTSPWLGDFHNEDQGIPIFTRKLAADELTPELLPGMRKPLKNYKEAKERVSALLESLKGRKRTENDEPLPLVYNTVKDYYDQLWAEEDDFFPQPPEDSDGVPFPTPLQYVRSWPRSRQSVSSVHDLRCSVALNYLDNVTTGVDPDLWFQGVLHTCFYVQHRMLLKRMLIILREC